MPTSGRPRKSPGAFRTIGEVAVEIDVPQHVLRFWESKFPRVKPLKRTGGRRYYRPEDVALLRRIRELLYVDGYTVKGVQRLLREERASPALRGERKETSLRVTPPGAPSETERRAGEARGFGGRGRRELRAVLVELAELRDLLGRAGRL